MPSIEGYHPYGLAIILTGLIPIEPVRDMLGRRIAARQPPSACLPELRRALLDEWCNIPQDQIDNLILSMPRRSYNKKRCAAVPFETGIHFRRKTDFFPEEDTTKSYSGFEPEPTRLQAEGHSHHTGWATQSNI
ncbi:uncharacterized protein TNCV_714421 [Trichonephila clavipes]|nr:uncharacterized protein TNCV_714421 [Trichonephila clavipes]